MLCDEIAALLGPREEEEIRRSIRELEEKIGKRGDNKTIMDPDFQKLQGYRTFRFHFHQLHEQVATPRFRRCLLLCGSTGAGKTHRTLCFEPDPYRSAGVDPEEESNDSTVPQGPTASAPWRCLVLWLELKASATRSLEEEILQGIGQMTGRPWSSLQELDESLERATRQTGGQHGAPRLVVVIDDLQSWLRARPGFLDELAKLLDRTTQLHSLYWVISLQETAYDAITGEAYEELWRRMSVTPAQRLRAFHRRRNRNTESQEPEGLLGSWIDLDNLNRRESLGLKIIARETPGFTFEYIDPEERPRELTNPQLAWILLDWRDQFPPQLAVSLHFIGFVELFWDKRWQSLASSLQGALSLSEVEMKQVTSLVAHAMVEHTELSLEKGRLIEAAVNRGRELLQRDLRAQVTAGIPLLEAAGLLSFETVEGGPLGAEEHLWLRALFFWYFHLAQQLFLDFAHLSGGALEKWLHSLPQRFSRFFREDREGTLEFLLLLADKNLRDDRALALWRSALGSAELPQSALWLAAAKSSPWAQQLAMEFAGEQRVRTDERRPLFTFLYFLGEVRGFSPSHRTALLQPLFAAIRQADLQRYCLFVLRRILDTIKTEEEWIATAASLPGCENLEKTEEIGRMMVDRAAELEERSSQDLLSLFVRYLRTEKPEHRGETVFSPWKRHFVREWILFAGFDLISLWKQQEKLGPAALFHEVREIGWYEYEKLGIGRRVGREMEQEANIALGHWYSQSSWPEERDEFEELVTTLVEGKSKRDRQLGFFLIRHTGKPNQDDVIIVPPVFGKLLRRIYTDQRLDWLKKAEPFRTEFRVNLPHLAGEVGKATSPQRNGRPTPTAPRRGPRRRST